jgi:hypothetical protein
MAIRITCSKCTRSFTVSPDQAGLVVSCPTCFKKHPVPAPALDTVSSTTDDSGDDVEYTLSPAVELPSRHAAPPPVSADNSHLVTASPQPVSRPTSTPASAGPSTTCERCGAIHATATELCPHCFYHAGLKRVVDIRDHDDPLLAEHGFRRYLLAKLNKDQSPESVFFLIDAMAVLSGLLLYVLQHRLAVIMVPLVVMYLIYRIAVRIGRLWYSGRSLLWYSVLLLGRSLSWRTLGGQERKHATRRGKYFGDADLKTMPELDSYAVLDFEGTDLTDSGLEPLKSQTTLEFLILRKTRVTPDGVWELQKTIPHTCIWF